MNNARNVRLQQEADIEREKLKQRAKDDGTDMDRLVFESAKWSWRDDGLLPAATGSTNGRRGREDVTRHYCAAKGRNLSGWEEQHMQLKAMVFVIGQHLFQRVCWAIWHHH